MAAPIDRMGLRVVRVTGRPLVRPHCPDAAGGYVIGESGAFCFCFLRERHGLELELELEAERERCTFAGDSPNDAPMFAYLPHAVGVANVAHFDLPPEQAPAYVTPSEGGAGFAQLAQRLLDARR